MKKCLVCMHDDSEEQERCPACGYSERQLRLDSEKFTEALEPGSGLMGGRFIIGRILSYSNFSILYLSWDTLMSRRVVIREYFPCGICKREGKSPSIVSAKGKERIAFMNGRKMFETENSCLNQNQDLPEIVNIYRCFRENETTYSVSEYLEGNTLQEKMDTKAAFGREQADAMFKRICDAVERIHERGILHLNLSPESIYIMDDKQIKLIDFGEAKEEAERQQDGCLELFDARYAAPEILKGEPYSTAADLYSLGAIYYQMITGKYPPRFNMKKKGKKKIKVQGEKATLIIDTLMEEDVRKRAATVEQFRKAVG